MKKLLPLMAIIMLLSSCAGESLTAPGTTADEPVEVYIMTGTTQTTASESESATSIVTEPATASTTAETSATTAETTAETTAATTAETTSETAAEIDEPPVPDVYVTGDYSYKYHAHSELVELESGIAGPSGSMSEDMAGFSGAGTVRAEGEDVAVTAAVTIPRDGHYNITLRVCSDEPADGRISCDDPKFRHSVSCSGSGEYESLRFDCIYFKEGEHELSLGGFDSPVYLDCLLIESTDAVQKLSYNVANKAVTEGVSRATRHLYRYLAKIYGDSTLSAQTCTAGTNDEIDAIYNATGKYPAIRFGELGGYSSGEDSGDIELAIKWWEDGGLVAYNWYWEMGGSLYLENGFDLKAAVTGMDIAAMDGAVLTERYTAGAISTETLMLIDGIDLVAEQLKRLRDEGIPVIFRPLPEAGNGVFWWGADAESYLWLYKLIFNRFDYYHGLDNIIWVWNGQSEDFYPGRSLVDVVSVDLYYPDGEEPSQSGVNFMIRAQDVSSKPAAISECAVLPDPDDLKKDNCAWLFCGVFSGEYADIDGELSLKNMTLNEWDRFYSADNVITRDEIDYE